MLRYLDRWEVTLGPGELLFVPAGAAHAVTNLSHTAAISANFVDSTNLSQPGRRNLASRELRK